MGRIHLQHESRWRSADLHSYDPAAVRKPGDDYFTSSHRALFGAQQQQQTSNQCQNIMAVFSHGYRLWPYGHDVELRQVGASQETGPAGRLQQVTEI